jgi:Tol biopolymer transport system component
MLRFRRVQLFLPPPRFARLVAVALVCSAALACARSRTALPVEPPPVYTRSDTAALFAPGVISTGDVFASSFTPDGRTVYITKTSSDRTTMQIMTSSWSSGGWSQPRRAPFSTGERQMDPHVAPNGKTVYFTAPRRRGARLTEPDGDLDTWTASLEKGDPSEATRVESLANSTEHESYPSITIDETLFFGIGQREGGALARREVAYFSKKVRTTPVKLVLPDISNPGNPFITPNGRVLIVSATGKDERTRGDLYVVTRGGDGRWSTPRNLGREVNSDETEYCPSLSPDGRHLFFSRMHQVEGRTTGSDIYVVPVTSVPVLRAALEAR